MNPNSNKAFEAFKYVVDQKLSVLRNSFKALKNAVYQLDEEQLISCANGFLTACNELRGLIPQSMPPWAVGLKNEAYNYVNNPTVAYSERLISEIYAVEIEVEEYDWTFDPELDGTPDLTSILHNALNENEINQSFDNIIEILREMVLVDDLDHTKAHADLIAIIAMLRKAKKGGYAEKVFTWDFVRRFIPNLVLEHSKSIPLLGPTITAFEKTAKEVDDALMEVRNDTALQFKAAIESSLETEIQEFEVSPIILLADHTSISSP